MGSIEPTFGDEYRTPVHPTTTVDTNPTPVIMYGGLHQDMISMRILSPFDNPLILLTLLLKVDHLVKL
jgi:hypothetical protein